MCLGHSTCLYFTKYGILDVFRSKPERQHKLEGACFHGGFCCRFSGGFFGKFSAKFFSGFFWRIFQRVFWRIFSADFLANFSADFSADFSVDVASNHQQIFRENLPKPCKKGPERFSPINPQEFPYKFSLPVGSLLFSGCAGLTCNSWSGWEVCHHVNAKAYSGLLILLCLLPINIQSTAEQLQAAVHSKAALIGIWSSPALPITKKGRANGNITKIRHICTLQIFGLRFQGNGRTDNSHAGEGWIRKCMPDDMSSKLCDKRLKEVTCMNRRDQTTILQMTTDRLCSLIAILHRLLRPLMAFGHPPIHMKWGL